MTVLRGTDIETFATDGYLVVPGLVGEELLAPIDAEVERLMAATPPAAGHIGPHFYWPGPAEAPALFAPLEIVLAVAGELTAPGEVELAFDNAQIALNLAPFVHKPGRHHLDGYAPDREIPATFTLLAGLLINDQTEDNTGNLWVWPGTHRRHAALFTERGADEFNRAAGYPEIDLPEPVQVRGRRGDVVFAHYLLGHNTGGNFASSRTRCTLYWRLRSVGHAERWAEALGDEWLEFDGVRRTTGR